MKWAPNKGQQFDVTIETQSTSQTLYSKRTTTTVSQLTLSMEWEVVGVDPDGRVTFLQTVRSIKGSVSNPAKPEQTLRFDSASAQKLDRSSKTFLAGLKPLIGQPIQVEIKETGEVVSARLVQSDPDAEATEQDALAVVGAADANDLVKQFAESVVKFPAKKMQSDVTWSSTNQLDLFGGTVEETREFKFKKIEQKNDSEIAIVTFQTIYPTEDSPSDSSRELDVQISEYKKSGDLRFNLTSGMIISSETRGIVTTQREYHGEMMQTTVESQDRIEVVPVEKSSD